MTHWTFVHCQLVAHERLLVVRVSEEGSTTAGWYFGNCSPSQSGEAEKQGLDVNYTSNVARGLSTIADVQGVFGVNETPGSNATVYGPPVEVTVSAGRRRRHGHRLGALEH